MRDGPPGALLPGGRDRIANGGCLFNAAATIGDGKPQRGRGDRRLLARGARGQRRPTVLSYPSKTPCDRHFKIKVATWED